MLASRRRFLMFAAPAIVAAPSLMRVSATALEPSLIEQVGDRVSALYGPSDYSLTWGEAAFYISPSAQFYTTNHRVWSAF